MAYYITLGGIDYDRKLVEKAQYLANGKGDGRISVEDIQTLYRAAQDAGKITEVEERTLWYVLYNFNATQAAMNWLRKIFPDFTDGQGLEAQIEKLIRQDLQLPNLKWIIQEAEVKRQETPGAQQTFLEALKLGIEAHLYEAESSTSLRDIIYLETGSDLEDFETIKAKTREWLDEGTLYLIPLNYPSLMAEGTFTFPIPDDIWSIQEFWLFGLDIPTRTQWKFMALVRRQMYEQYFSFGYPMSDKTPTQWIENILNEQFGLAGIQWTFEPGELDRQLRLPGNLVFNAALRAAMYAFLYDDQGPESPANLAANVFEKLRRQDFASIVDFHEALDTTLKPLFREGKLRLTPLTIYETNPDDLVEINIPPNGESVLDNWIFQLNLPTLSDHVFFAIVPRSGAMDVQVYGFN